MVWRSSLTLDRTFNDGRHQRGVVKAGAVGAPDPLREPCATEHFQCRLWRRMFAGKCSRFEPVAKAGPRITGLLSEGHV